MDGGSAAFGAGAMYTFCLLATHLIGKRREVSRYGGGLLAETEK